MSETRRRPGGALATRPLHFFWIVDCSGSMGGAKIASVNAAIQECIPEMRQSAAENPNAQLYVRTVKFSTGASWVTAQPVKIEDYNWTNLQANGLTDLGAALDLVTAELKIPPMSERALPPVMVLLSDGQPTNDYKRALQNMMSQGWGRKSVRIAISIGQDADDDVLTEFTGNRELVLQANNARTLVKMIKWASTLAAEVSQPKSRAQTDSGSNLPICIDMDSIPTAEPDAPGDAEDVW